MTEFIAGYIGAKNNPITGKANATNGTSLKLVIASLPRSLDNGTINNTTAADKAKHPSNTKSQSNLFKITPARNLPIAKERDKILAI